MHPTPEEPPRRLDRQGLPRPDERTTLLIVLVGVVVGALALAAVLGYIVFHALTEQPRTTVGLGGSPEQRHNVALVRGTGAVRALSAHPESARP